MPDTTSEPSFVRPMTFPQFNDRQMAMGRDQQWLIPAIAIAIVAAICAATLSYITGHPGQPSATTGLTVAIAVVVITAFFRFIRFSFGMWRSGEPHPLARICGEFQSAALSFTPVVAGVAILSTFLYSITFLKSLIPVVMPFWADELLAATDHALFIDPQAIALALKPALPALGIFYGLWHAAHLGGILWVLHWRQGDKARFIIGFMLTWAIGMLFAYLFASMGPIFTGKYDPSVAPAITRKAAEFLWSNYQADSAMLGAGISAFPSMHVALAAWLALALRERGWLKTGIAYFSGMFACSVILGWHYTIDGLAGAAIALAADRLTRAWLRRKQRRSSITSQPACAQP